MLHCRHEQSGFHFLILDLKDSKHEHSSIFSGTKAHTFGAKKEIVSDPYFTVLRTLLEKSFYVLGLYGKVLLILKTSPIIAGESPLICLYIYISIAKVWIFLWCTEKKTSKCFFVYIVDFVV